MVFRDGWLLSVLFLFLAQSCLADDQFNFNPARLFSRKLCPSCDTRSGLYPSFRHSLPAQAQISISQVESQSRISNKEDHAAGELMHPRRNNKYNKAWIVSTAAIMMLLVSTIWHMTMPYKRLEEEQESNGETKLHDDSDNSDPRFTANVIRKITTCFCSETKIIRNQVGSQGLHLFPLDGIQKATKNFSIENKLGEGGSGCVYKGQLANGEEIAVKRLIRSIASGQGPTEFQNEANIISKLRHKNLVRLLGCCTEQNEMLLVYEYMATRKLDDILSDPTQSVLLEWKTRMSIINGIVRGLLYLHEDCGHKIIHGNLRPGNVLLDDEMNPKISDFGLSEIFIDHESEVSTTINAGTIGYFAPEYVLEGQISFKSDVFSFGVLLLEIICVKKSSKLYILEHAIRMLDYIWELWCEGKALELIDRELLQTCDRIELLRCIRIGLLCVQENPTNRPTMSSVASMLASDGLLPEPTQPAYLYRRSIARSSRLFLSDIEDVSDNVAAVSISNISPQAR